MKRVTRKSALTGYVGWARRGREEGPAGACKWARGQRSSSCRRGCGFGSGLTRGTTEGAGNRSVGHKGHV